MKRIRRKLFGGALLCLILLFCTLTFSRAQNANFVVKGTIKDSKGEALIGVSVKLKGTAIGASSDAKGGYLITLPDNTGTLVFSYVGFLTKEIPVGNNRVIDISLENDTRALEEVVITTGYGSQQKVKLSSAVSTVTAADLVRTPATTTSSALVGKVQGITARSSDSRPGNGANIQIRNLGAPLYVIDGVPYGGNSGTTGFGLTDDAGGRDAFNDLGLEDVESVTILKDASASIYGVRAANGVVLVTTKKGKKGDKSSIDVSSYYGFQDFTRFFQPASASQYVRAQLEAAENGGASPAAISLVYTPDQYAKWQAGTEKGFQSTDYLDAVTEGTPPPQSYLSVSARGGSQKSTYYFSVSNLNQKAIIKDFNYNRTNLQANLEAEIASGLKVGANVSARIEKRHNVGVPGLDDYFNPFLSVLSMWPTERMYANDNPLYINQTHNVNVNPATYTDDITGYTNDLNHDAKATLSAEYQFKFGLNVKGTYSYDFNNEDFDCFEFTWKAYNYIPTLDVYNDGTYYGGALYGNQNPFKERHKRNVINRFGQFQLNYKKQLGDHSIAATAAFEQSDYGNEYFIVHTVPPNNYIPLQFFANQDVLTDQYSAEARQGIAGKLDYDYKSKYLVSFLGRYDGSYLYAPGKRWGFFPGVSLGWRISEEPFFKNKVGFLDELKIRASYGEQGKEQGINAFGYLAGVTFNSGSSVFNGSYVTGEVPRGLPVTQLSWVVSHSKDIGIDFAMFNNHLSGTFDAFQIKRTGLPASRYDVTVPSETGTTLANENLESDENVGIEGILTYRNTVGKVNYSIGANTTISRAKVLDKYKPRYGNSYDQYTSQTADRWTGASGSFGYHVIGRFESQADIDSYGINNDGQGNRTELPGDFKFQDTNGDGIISTLDRRPISYVENSNPFGSLGINGSVGYKGLQLSFDFAGGFMQSFSRDFELKFPFQNNGNSPEYMFDDRWHHENPYDPTSPWIAGTYPALRNAASSNINYQLRSDFWVTNVHYLRLKNLELGYSLPTKWAKRVGANSIRVYANGTNLLSFDNVKQFQIDPEINSGNGLLYPQQRLYNFGFKLSF